MIYKIAARKKLDTNDFIAGTIAPLGTSIGVGLTLEGLNKDNGTANYDAIKQNLATSATPTYTNIREHTQNRSGAGYLPAEKTLILPKNSQDAIIAHEMAHSTSKYINHPLGQTAYGVGKLMSLGAGSVYGALKGARGESMDKKEMALSLIPSLGFLPEETRANLIAAKTIYKMKGAKGLLAATPILLASEGSYLTGAAAPIIANKVSKYFYDKKHKKKK